jgi:D-cysteine desulfhydrase family pyridoxal phosphate-dependent enzyme
LVRLAAFSQAIGIDVWMKRDDTGSMALAGNKVRKLEFTLARAQMDGATVIVCVGPQQSNSVRATASASAMIGLRCVAVLEGDSPDISDGNLLIDRLVGAEIHFSGTHDWDVLDAQAAAIAADLTAQGERVYVLPMGGSVPLGSLGFAAAYAELLDQADAVGLRPTAIVHASSTGGSHAGLELGHRLLGGPRIQAMGVAKGPVDLATRVAGLAQSAAEIIGVDERWTADDVNVDSGYLGPAYGIPTEACLEAIGLLARTEAILCDPVYSGKALAGLIDYARTGNLDGPVVFWHTGGALALFTQRYAGTVGASLEAGHAA